MSVCCSGCIYPDFMNSMPDPWSDSMHVVNSSKTEQTARAGHHLQLWESLLLSSVPCWWRLMHLRTVTGLKRDTDLADALHQGLVQKCVSVHAFLLGLSFPVGYRLGLLQLFFFPSQSAFVVSASVTHTLLTCWPWAPPGSLTSALRTDGVVTLTTSHPDLSHSSSEILDSSWVLFFLFYHSPYLAISSPESIF